jgi:aminoglycoside phosphotransferase (APT) family kinase protein
MLPAMPPLTPPDALDRLRATIVAAFPELAGASFVLAPRGWDSIAVDVGDRLIFKFPRHEAARLRLEKEARLLAAIRPRVAMPVPDMTLIETPEVFSRHEKLRGDYLEPAIYAGLPAPNRQRLAEQLARFYAELHALDDAEMRSLGAQPIEPWREPQDILREAVPLLPARLRRPAEAAVAAYVDLPADSHGATYGFFDGHGWNMAFDASAQRLNGVFDFGDSGFGPLHQEFIYSSLTAFDLTDRIVGAYERLTGRPLDRERIHLLTGIHALSEFPVGDSAAGIARLERWAGAG